MFQTISLTMPIRRVLSKSYQTYKKAKNNAFNKKNLFYTNVLFSMSMSMLGDLIEQHYEVYTNKIEKIDFERTRQMGLSGVTAGIISHHWYNFLDRVIVGRSFKMVIKKLLLDQFISSPIIILSFFATVAIFEEKPLESFNEEVQGKFWKLYMAEWVVWPPAQMINFYFLPTKYRVLFDNTVSLGYDVYNSQVKHHKVPKKTEEIKKNRMQSIGVTWRQLATKAYRSKTATNFRRIAKVAFSDKYLFYTNVTISVTLSSVGDILEQQYEIYTKDMERWDPKRTMHMAFSGVAVGVLCHHWYKVLDRFIVGKTVDMVAKKLFLDQIIFSPVMIVTFFGSVALFEADPLENFKEEVKDKFVTLYKAEWMVWPPAQIINFYFLPTRFRVLYDNTISLGYDVYTSQVKHSKSIKTAIESGKSKVEACCS